MEMDTELPSKSIDILVVLYVFHKRWRIGKMRREDAQGASERFGRTHVTFGHRTGLDRLRAEAKIQQNQHQL